MATYSCLGTTSMLASIDDGSPHASWTSRVLSPVEAAPEVQLSKLACRKEFRSRVGLDEEGEMGIGTPAPIDHEHLTRWSERMDGLHLGEIMGEEGRDHELQEESGAGMEQPQQPRHGKAAPRPLLCRLAQCFLSSRGIGHGASRAIDEKRAMAMPPAFTRDGGLHRAAEALQEEGTEAQRESGAGLTGGRRTEPQARQRGQMTAGGVARQDLPQE
jgi:hypothetical protein